MGKQLNDWKLEHFVTYLYVCIAKADYNLVDEEIVEIYKKLKRFHEDEEINKKLLQEVLREYAFHSDSEIIQFIKTNCPKYCETEEEKKKLIKDLEDIMEADGIVKDVEMVMYRYIKKVLNSRFIQNT